ncbi:MAG: galactokinase [Gammaproteobacteria bacterium]|nr:galactokinase [Gammaproteobacteria bacterium]
MTPDERQASDRFRATYGAAPRWVASAPGRVNLIGEFTDYNDGLVLPMAIARRTAIAAAPNGTDQIMLKSDASDTIATIELNRPIVPTPRPSWGNYPRGIVAGFLEAGLAPCGLNALVCSNVPIGAGLSSSAALESAMTVLLETVVGTKLDPIRAVLLCQTAEHNFAGVPCGIMDPFICLLGRPGQALLLDCRSREPDWLPFEDPTVEVLIVNTNVRHELASSEYPDRRRRCSEAARRLAVASLREASMERLQQEAGHSDDTTWRCARHVVTEIDRTRRAAEAIRARDWPRLGRLMDESHESLKSDFRVSCAELDLVSEIAAGIGPQGGVFGARMTGGGFGGCAIALVLASARETIAAAIRNRYLARTGVEPTLFVSRPAEGARVIEA